MLSIFSALANVISAPVTQWIKNRGEKSMAKHTRELSVIRGDQSWEQYQAQASQGSWKDEYLTVLITTPMVMMFIAPFMSDDYGRKIKESIELVNNMPSEYWYLMSATFAAAFAIKGIPAAIAKMRHIKKAP